MEPVVIGPCTLFCADCRDVLPLLEGVDAVVTDPPYGIKAVKRGTIGSSNRAPVTDYGSAEWDNEPADPEVISSLLRMSRWQVIFGGNYFHLPPSSCWLVWDKRTTGDFADFELAWTNLDKAVRKIEWLWNGMIRKGNESRFHPTQKPAGVMTWCVSHLPSEATTILDPYMGSGTTGIAAIRHGRRFIGIERDPQHFATACRRIRDAVAAEKSSLFPAGADL